MKIKRIVSLVFGVMMSFNLWAQTDYYTTQVVFPANYQVGDYIEFLKVGPIDAGASGNYEISISYTRDHVAAAATHLASISHSNPAIWREAGRMLNNPYTSSDMYNFTIDCNTESGNPRFRIRAVKTLGRTSDPTTVNIKVRSINFNSSWTALNNAGNDLSVNKFLPMTNDWSLYVGNLFVPEGANLAIKAVENGNVGIGTATPTEKLSVNGKIRAKEIKVETSNWPDYVFHKDYQLLTLTETENHIREKGHLPGIPSAKEVEEDGIDLGNMNKKLVQKIEELTLYLIEKDKQLLEEKKTNADQEKRIKLLEEKLSKLSQ